MQLQLASCRRRSNLLQRDGRPKVYGWIGISEIRLKVPNPHFSAGFVRRQAGERIGGRDTHVWLIAAKGFGQSIAADPDPRNAR